MTLTLTELRDHAAEVGLELVYRKEKSKTDVKEFEPVTHDNFNPEKLIGLSRKGELFISPITATLMAKKLARAVARVKKKKHIERTKGLYGVES